jgi:hypothetical protein
LGGEGGCSSVILSLKTAVSAGILIVSFISGSPFSVSSTASADASDAASIISIFSASTGFSISASSFFNKSVPSSFFSCQTSQSAIISSSRLKLRSTETIKPKSISQSSII